MKRLENVVRGIGTIMLAGTVLLGVGLSGVFAIDGPTGEPVAAELQETDENQEEREEPQEEKDGGETEELQDDIPDETLTEDSGRGQQSADVRSEQQSYGNAISGVIWLDENEDGLMDSEEPGIGDFPVSLYQDDQIIDTVETDADGGYRFEQLDPGEYIIGIQSEIINETEYLIPLCGISGDNKFILTELEDGSVVAFSDPVRVTMDTQVEDLNAGIRLPLETMPTAGEPYIVNVITGTSAGATNGYSTLAEAVAACPADEESVITVTQDDTISSSVTISDQKTITLISSENDSWTIAATGITGNNTATTRRHLCVTGNSTLILENITLAGQGYNANALAYYNGGLYINEATVRMRNGATVQACSNYNGGGVYVDDGGSFTMTGDGKISGNKTPYINVIGDGGGVYVDDGGSFMMTGGLIIDNESHSGGGVYVDDDGSFTMTGDGKISENKTAYGVGIFSAGGGVYVGSGSFTMTGDGKISENEATYGGGVYMDNSSNTFEMESGEIIDNTASSSGGGIYTDNYSYSNPADLTKYTGITIKTAAVVQGNTSSATYGLPVNYADLNVGNDRFPGDLLNNDEINYKGPYLITYHDNDSGGERTWNASSGTGNVSVTLLTASGAGFTNPAGYELKEWNTQADGNGTGYVPGETTDISESLTLYAIWRLPGYEITEEYYDDAGNQIKNGTGESVAAGGNYEKTAPVLAGYRYLGYRIDSGALQTGATVTISNVNDNYTVTFMYEKYAETIHVSVPVKLLWASFESDAGDVRSPDYYFYNHSSYDINVSLQELTVTDPAGLDLVESATAKSGAGEVALQLDPLSGSQSGWRTTSQISLMAGGSGLLGKLEADSQGYFDITGTYGGYFTSFDLANGDYLQPVYEAVFRFELTH